MMTGMMCDPICVNVATDFSDLIRTSFKSILTQIAELSPSDSVLNAQLRLKDGQFAASVEIHSSELNITTEKKEENIVALLSSIKHDLMEQIEAWKKVRSVETHSA